VGRGNVEAILGVLGPMGCRTFIAEGGGVVTGGVACFRIEVAVTIISTSLQVGPFISTAKAMAS